jgi:hypothetical protein
VGAWAEVTQGQRLRKNVESKMDVQEVTVMVNFNFLRKLQEILINMVA